MSCCLDSVLTNPGVTAVFRVFSLPENATYSSAVVMCVCVCVCFCAFVYADLPIMLFLNTFLWYEQVISRSCFNFSSDISTHVVHLHGIFTGLAVSSKRISRPKSCPYAGASVRTINTRCFSPPTSHCSFKTRLQPRQTENCNSHSNCNVRTSPVSSRRCVHTFLSRIAFVCFRHSLN